MAKLKSLIDEAMDGLALEAAVRELMEHLEEFCEFPQNPRERQLSEQIYTALGDNKEKRLRWITNTSIR